MYLAEILCSDIENFNQLQKTIRYYDIKGELEDRIHGGYNTSINGIIRTLKSVLIEIQTKVDYLPDNIVLQLYKEICVRMEIAEEEISTGVYQDNRYDVVKHLEGNDVLTYSNKYTNLIYNQYKELCEVLQREVKELYSFKCDVIDAFNQMAEDKRMVS